MDVPGGSANVNMAGCTASQFAYAPLDSSLTLQANTEFYLVSQEFSGGDQWYDQSSLATMPVATVESSVFSYGTGWAAETVQTAYGPPTFLYTVP